MIAASSEIKRFEGFFCLNLRDFLLKANSISSSSGVDGFQRNPLGDSVQSKDNTRIGKILGNTAFIQNSIDQPQNEHK